MASGWVSRTRQLWTAGVAVSVLAALLGWWIARDAAFADLKAKATSQAQVRAVQLRTLADSYLVVADTIIADANAPGGRVRRELETWAKKSNIAGQGDCTPVLDADPKFKAEVSRQTPLNVWLRQIAEAPSLDTDAEGAPDVIIYLINRWGLVIAGENYWRPGKENFLGKCYSDRPYFRNAVRNKEARDYFQVSALRGRSTGKPGLFLSRAVTDNRRSDRPLLGVVVVKISAPDIAELWAQSPDPVLLTARLSAAPQSPPECAAYMTEPKHAVFASNETYLERLRPRLQTVSERKSEPSREPWLLQAWGQMSAQALPCWREHNAEIGPPPDEVQSANIAFSLVEGRHDRPMLGMGDLRPRGDRSALVDTAIGTYVMGTAPFGNPGEQEISVRALSPTTGAENAALLAGVLTGLLAAVSLLAAAVLRLVEQRRRAALELASSGELALYMTHDMMNALNSIVAFTWDRTAKGEAHIDRQLRAEVDRLAAFCQLVLPQLRGKTPAAMPVSVRDVIDLARRLYGRESEQGSAPVEVQSFEADVAVPGELVRLASVVLNLMQNANKAMKGRADAKITIATATQDQMVLISVADTGPGLPENFDMFALNASKNNGTGVGLTLARYTVERFGGKLSAANQAMGGAVFTISLPLVDPP